MRLFAERAAAVKPGFQVTGQNAAAVAAVVRRLDGIALAVELAAARVPAMTPAELARRLERSFAVLAAGRRGAEARHQTLRATIDWSFQLLAGPEQALLARLAVFAGGCHPGGRRDGLRRGGHRSGRGVRAAGGPGGKVTGSGRGTRAADPLPAAGDDPPVRRGTPRGGRRGRAVAGPPRQLLRRPAASRVRDSHDPQDEVFWATRLSAEQDNLLAAWSWAIGTSNVDTAFQILAGFAPVEVRNTDPLVLAGEAALELPGAAGHPGYPLALAVSAVFASNRADVTGAEELCRRAADANARRDTPDWRVEATVCAARSNIAITTGAFADAARLAEQAADLARAGGDLADASVELTYATSYHLLTDDAPAAVPLAREALALARQTGAPALIATGLLAVGATVAGTDPEQARTCLRESRELSTALGHHSAVDLLWATAIAFLVGDQAATLELGCRAIRGFQWAGTYPDGIGPLHGRGRPSYHPA